MHHGKYDFQDFLHGDIESNYTTLTVRGRTLHRPTKKLKVYHGFLNTFIFEYLSLNPRVVYSYRKGVNPNQAVLPHSGSRAFFQADLINFFGNIDRELVRSTLLARASLVPVSNLLAHLERILDLTLVEDSLPIGFPTSPPLSNACLTDFDDALEAHCRARGLIYTRYADDIVVSGHSREDLDQMGSILSTLLNEHFAGKLRLNPWKTKLSSMGRRISVLGMVITPTGHVTISRELKQRIEVLLHFYIRDRVKFSDIFEGDIKRGISQLAGYINYVNTADQPYLQKLRSKYGTTVIDSFLHQSAT